MCFHSKQSKSAQELQNRFNAKFVNANTYKPGIYNGFQYPETPIITNRDPEMIQLYHWGLIPSWAKDTSFRKNTLNARYETIHEKPSFRSVANNRCLVLANGFFEWQWLDEKGKFKQKYEVHLPEQEAYAYAGLWSEWVDINSGELIHTYTILTTQADEFMSRIHNSKKRMPMIIAASNECDWLNRGDIILQNHRLIADPI